MPCGCVKRPLCNGWLLDAEVEGQAAILVPYGIADRQVTAPLP
jgi:hypothetical protein